MAVSTKRPLPRLTSLAQVVEWGRRIVEELAWLRQEFGTAINAGGSGGAPTNATYVTLTTNATLTSERTLAVGAGLTKVDAGAGLTITLDMGIPGLPAGTYGADPTQTLALDVNAYGQVTNYTLIPIAIDMAQVSQNTARILGRTTAGYGVTQELTVGTGLTLSAGSLSLTTPVALANGGTAADLSATGGTGKVLKQATLGGAVTVGTVAASEVASGAALTRTNDTNVTLTLGGTPTTALLAATSLTLGWTGTLGLARGGTAADLSATGGTSQVLRQSTLGGAVTVGQLAFSDISGSVTDAQVPDTITLSNITQITTRPHSSLSSLVSPADDHTQYLNIGGRSGTGNDAILSTSQGGIFTGSSAAGAYGLKLRANSNTTYATTGQGSIELWDQVTTISNIVTALTLPASITFDSALSIPSVISVPSTSVWTFTANPAIGALLFNFSPTMQNGSGSARTLPGVVPFYSGPKFIGDNALLTVTQDTLLQLLGSSASPTASTTGANGAVTITDLRGLTPLPYFTGGSAGTNTVTITRMTDVESQPTLNAPSAGGKVTIATRRGLWFRLATLAGAGAASLKEITDQVAVEVEDLSSASYTTTTLCSLRSAGSSVQMRHAGAARFGANSAPVTTLDVRGGLSVGTAAKSADYTATAADFLIVMTTGAAAKTVTFPSAANAGQIIMVVKADSSAGACQVLRAGSDTIEGVTTAVSLGTAQYSSGMFIADGTSTWYRMDQ